MYIHSNNIKKVISHLEKCNINYIIINSAIHNYINLDLYLKVDDLFYCLKQIDDCIIELSDDFSLVINFISYPIL